MTTAPPADATTIRQAVRADLLEVHQVERRAFTHPWSMDALEQFLGEPGFLVAESPTEEGPLEATIVGHVVATGVRVNGQPMGHVKDLAVNPERQGEGIGSTLLDRAMTVLSRRGFSQVRLEVRETNERAIGLYERRGFSRVGTYASYYPDGEDALILHAPLQS
ncbi:ribosomal protein S18-alanine N-acetyltransferase [Halanaeroarchaeum sulfurireducens]|uniref:Ribosomal-protein-alanine acetyltransferase n=1 Tax=Halanaeroarchaeum sulfurireducens TaxID=1604004 RepID=A0A0F7PBB4_9EURY|nr:ribosomal protein S18-alanine N-acetyltransferase [Halanaeroarchaeum sulfurireducens]AKH96929.1 ribosomal-protein-alanine acetyltransferase [Halanaeroarchaeum sulfurireducens]ALG81331.1 ribosomal-protein-alanine acetyltransferase [Halanaeroarchaeum sulfurireducens]